jgi:predicted Rossmann fold flavoprotein
MNYDIIVIGAGTSAGFLLAFLDECGTARKPNILLLEKTKAPFRKIYTSGNGRCNFSNTSLTPSSYYSVSGSAAWKKSAFEAAARLDLCRYFFDRGIPSCSDEYGRLMPYTNSAKTIGNYFERYLNSPDITLKNYAEALEVAHDANGYAVRYKHDNEVVDARARIVVFAAGGSAYPQLGTDGSGFTILRGLGHSVTEQAAGIVPLEIEEAAFQPLAGLKMECGISVGEFSRKGELLFTKHGISGPNVLYASNSISLGLLHGPVEIDVDFLPEEQFTPEYFRSIHARAKEKTMDATFGGALSLEFLKAFSMHNHLKAVLSLNEVESVCRRLKASRFTVTGTRPLKEAQVSLGGVVADEVDPVSFESKLHKDLFVLGEALDYTGGSGGYNIHWCAATARGAADRISGMPRPGNDKE